MLSIFDALYPLQLDPLAPRSPIERACAWAFETRRQLTARGGSSGGGGGRGSSGRRRQSAAQQRARALAHEQRETIRGSLATMRNLVRENEKRARALARQVAKAEAELRYRERLFTRSAVAQQREAFKQLQRQTKAEARAAAQSRAALRKISALVRSAPGKRTQYQRRVVGGLARQAQRGEALSIRRATHKPLPTSPTGLQQRAVERIISTYGSHPDFERSTVEINMRNLAEFPRILEHIIRVAGTRSGDMVAPIPAVSEPVTEP